MKTALLCIVAVLTACGTTTFQRAGAPSIVGQLVDADADFYYIENGSGQVYRLRRSEVGELDHPGNVLAGFGIAMLGMSAVLYATIEKDDRALALVYGVPGTIMTTAGLIPWLSSRSAARQSKRRAQRVDGTILPPLPNRMRTTDAK